MRTTINIHDELLRKAKETALRRHCTLGRLIEDALRKSLARKSSSAPAKPTRLPTSGGRGLQPGVDLDSTVSLLDIMEER
jgi:hypothetical protein